MVKKEKIWKETFRKYVTEKGISGSAVSVALGKNKSYIGVKFAERNPAYFTPVQVLALQAFTGRTREELLEIPERGEVEEPEKEVVDTNELLELLDKMRDLVIKLADQ